MEKCLESSQPGWTQPKAAGQNSSTLWSICRTELGPISCRLHPPHPGPLSLKGLSQVSSQAPSLSGATTEWQSGPSTRPSVGCSRDRCDFIGGGPEVKCKVPECDSVENWTWGVGEAALPLVGILHVRPEADWGEGRAHVERCSFSFSLVIWEVLRLRQAPALASEFRGRLMRSHQAQWTPRCLFVRVGSQEKAAMLPWPPGGPQQPK